MDGRGVGELTIRWAERLDDASTVLSGFGAWPLLAMLATAADEPGRSELAAATGVQPPEAGATWATDLLALVRRTPDLRTALGVWVAENLKLAESFGAVLPVPLRGTLTGDPDRDRAMLDGWVTEHTDGLIRRMPLDVGPDLVLALASALSLRTTWAKPFAEHPRQLHDGPWGGRTVQWLNRTDPDLSSIRLYDDGLVTATVAGAGEVDVHLGLGTPQADAATVLPALLRTLARSTAPAAGTDGAALLAGAAVGTEPAPGLTVATTAARRPEVQLSLPAFEVLADHDLLNHADVFGLTAVTTEPRPPGHFSAISPEPLMVSQARQTVFARFFATGFEAAAVTAIGMTRAAMIIPETKQLRLTLDRPFAFAAVHRPTGIPIVAGWLATP